MTGESYSQRSADRGLNAVAGGDEDAVQTLAHHHPHRSSSSDVNESNGEVQAAATAPQCSSYFANASAAGPSSLVPASVSSAAAAAVLRSPTVKAPRIVSSEYTSTAPSAADSTAGAAPSTDGEAYHNHQRHTRLKYYDGDDVARQSAPSSERTLARGSGVKCDTSASSCAPSFRVDLGFSKNARPSPAPRFQLQPAPATKRRLAVAASANASRVPNSSMRQNYREHGNQHALSGHFDVKIGSMQHLRSCIAKPSVTSDPHLSGSENREEGRGEESSESSVLPSSVVSSASSSSSSSNWWCSQSSLHVAQAHVQTPFTSVQRRGVRLRRSRSLPNMKSKPTIDISTVANHRLLVPPRRIVREMPFHGIPSQERRDPHDKERRRQAASPTQAAYCHQKQGQQQLHCQYLRQLNHMATSTSNECPALTDSQKWRPQRVAHMAQADVASKNRQIYTPALQPPITRQTLKELDLHEILKNPQLRHDVVYDSNVQFRPNFDGERGRRKRDFGNKYWLAVQREIETGCTCTSFVGKMVLPCICSPQEQQRASQNGGDAPSSRLPSRLPALIYELRAICLSVLPASNGSEITDTPLKGSTTPIVTSERTNAKHDGVPVTLGVNQSKVASSASSPTSTSAPNSASSRTGVSHALGGMAWGGDHHMMIAQTLDPHLLTQQLDHSTPDVAGLVTFVGSVLKLHCAPMRDELIETMIATVCTGDVAQGLRLCFEVLELMKLDIANHQLRSSRTYLVETAVEFETRWFREQMVGKVSFERTSRWFSSALAKFEASAIGGDSTPWQSKTDVISGAFDDGFLSLVFEPPNAALLATPGRLASNLSLMSNASLNHACTGVYPETFQFDAFRLLAFHGDVSDITIVYMLLLLFRQLACSSQSLMKQPLPASSLPSSTITENASALAVAQLDAIKSEIWTLLNEAELELFASSRGAMGPAQQNGVSPVSPTTPTTPRTPATPPGIAGRILGGNMWPGRSKFENPRWRRAVGDIILQIASRAIQVQLQARQESSCSKGELSNKTPSPDGHMPSDATMSLLVQWLDRNLRTDSALHTLCSSRLRSIMAAHTALHRNGASHGALRTRKHGSDDEDEVKPSSTKKMRLQSGKAAPIGVYVEPNTVAESKDRLSSPERTTAPELDVKSALLPKSDAGEPLPDAAAMERAAGLEPLSGEIRVLADRMLKVKMLHLRVFRSVYEHMATTPLHVAPLSVRKPQSQSDNAAVCAPSSAASQ